jgi:cytochrome c553
VMLGHSTALSGKLVSPLNPRVFIIRAGTILAFHRGVQQVEIATRDRNTDGLNFFLITFEQSCNKAPSGCSPGDLYTPRIESDWTSVRIEDDEDLKNTPSDCRQCHQRGQDAPLLLMRERDEPWTHFFLPDQENISTPPEPTGSDLMRAYLAAKGDETYGGIPTVFLRSTVGINLEVAVQRAQPLLFDVRAILNERWPWIPDQGFASEPLPSATWYRNYEAFKRGEELALPHFHPMPTDPDKQARLSAVYASYRAGETGAEELPDLADIFPDDPQVRAEIGLQTEPGATPAQALVQACGACHNDVLDQSITRARFSIDLARMSRAELDVAIERLKAGADAGAMPPPGERQLDANARAQLIEYLERNVRSSADDALLGRAARIGMMGGGG